MPRNIASLDKDNLEPVMVAYKIDVLAALKDKGYSSYKLNKDNLLPNLVIQQLRQGKLVSWRNVGKICSLLHCNVGDVVEFTGDYYTPDTDTADAETE